MRFYLSLLLCFLSLSCSSPPLKVNQYHLKGPQNLSQNQNYTAMIRGEGLYRYDQNLSKKDRQEKLGHYYTFRWKKDLVDSTGDSLTLVFKYRQPATGQTAQTIRRTIDTQSKPMVEIHLIGQDYLKKGRIISWKASLKQGDSILASEQSFLWE